MRWIIGAMGVVLVLVGAVVLYGFGLEPYWIEVHNVAVDVRGMSESLRGKKAVHLTDLHIARLGKRELRVLEIVEAIAPDMIFLTGDYMPWEGDAGPALGFLGRLRAPDGVWGVMGDYEYSDGRQSCLFCHAPGSGAPTEAHDVRFLRNAAVRSGMDDGAVIVGGVDGDAFRAFDGWRVFLEGDAGAAAILLSHSPLVFDDLDGEWPVLVLAGDTHGGQIAVPRWFWRLIGYEKNVRYSHGWFEKGESRMYVSRGIGTSHWPVRFLRRPEVVVLHFD